MARSHKTKVFCYIFPGFIRLKSLLVLPGVIRLKSLLDFPGFIKLKSLLDILSGMVRAHQTKVFAQFSVGSWRRLRRLKILLDFPRFIRLKS